MGSTESLRLALIIALIALALPAAAEENWPQWRGAKQDGFSDATGLPTAWSETEHIVWKAPMPSWSGGSPAIWGDKILMTSPSAEETGENSILKTVGRWVGGGPTEGGGGDDLLLLCLSKADGSLLWERKLDSGNVMSRKQNASSPSPVTDGKHVWAVTGTGAVTALTLDGEQVWQRKLQEDYGDFGLLFGYASSPVLHEGMLIIQVVHGYKTDDPSYVLALDAATGETRWHVERPTDAKSETLDAYTTPALLHHEGKVQIVVAGGAYVTGAAPGSGKEIWRAGGLNPKQLGNFRIIASPMAVDGMVYACSRKKPILALRAGGEGDIGESHVVWKWESSGGPDVPTPACDGKHFYMVDDRGVITCLDAKTGAVIWGPERTASGTVSASPLVADGKVYIINEDAVTSVVSAEPEFKILATNTLEGGYTLSTPAVSGNRLFLRTATHLYCIGE